LTWVAGYIPRWFTHLGYQDAAQSSVILLIEHNAFNNISKPL